MSIGYFYKKPREMNKIFIFNNDDFREVSESDLEEMQTGNLIESLQGTLIGLHTIHEVTDRISPVTLGIGVQPKESGDLDINVRLTKGLTALISQLEPRLGRESVERIISETIFMVNLDKKQDGK